MEKNFLCHSNCKIVITLHIISCKNGRNRPITCSSRSNCSSKHITFHTINCKPYLLSCVYCILFYVIVLLHYSLLPYSCISTSHAFTVDKHIKMMHQYIGQNFQRKKTNELLVCTHWMRDFNETGKIITWEHQYSVYEYCSN